ncbi:ABC transporter ATP-binding protein [Glaciihabitans tibetensis]|nr:ABC transporter ATP-binding protein [Glaciihabitans tibetensis]
MDKSTVRFGEVVANDRVSFDLAPGEIHALLGENGAGKTTLMRVLAGLIQPDEGQVFVRGEARSFESVADSVAAGIGMVHQHFMLVPTLTVAENVSLGLRSAGRLFPNTARVGRELRALADKHGLSLDPSARVSDLSIGQQQRVEIVKALYRGATILILDEPTAVLTPGETDSLLAMLRSLTEQGTSVVFISHKLREIRAVADRVTVLRHGQTVGTWALDSVADAELTSAMIGRDAAPTVSSRLAPTTSVAPVPRLAVERVGARDRRGHAVLDSVSLSVAPGEILGIAGVDGNGQTELAEILSGVRRPSAGEVRLDGANITAATVAERIGHGLAHVPEDRQRTGLILDLSIAENLAMETVGTAMFSRRGSLNRAAVRAHAEDIISRFDIRCSGPDQRVRDLSGGNQQKVLIARAVSRAPSALVVSQPTRGVDLGAVENIHRQILDLAAQGCAVILISTELDEILALSDRIAVLYSGTIISTYDRATVDLGTLGMNMTGQSV